MTRDELSDELHEVWATAAEKLTLDTQLDLALAETFPASDPPALLLRRSMEAAVRAPSNCRPLGTSLDGDP